MNDREGRLTVSVGTEAKRTAVELAARQTLQEGRTVSVSEVLRDLISRAAEHQQGPRAA